MPSLDYILGAPVGQALPYIYQAVMGSPAGGLGLTILILIITFFCSISITVAASRCTWAFARDNAIPGSQLFKKVSKKVWQTGCLRGEQPRLRHPITLKQPWKRNN